jgi:hypothetical protein
MTEPSTAIKLNKQSTQTSSACLLPIAAPITTQSNLNALFAEISFGIGEMAQ